MKHDDEIDLELFSCAGGVRALHSAGHGFRAIGRTVDLAHVAVKRILVWYGDL